MRYDLSGDFLNRMNEIYSSTLQLISELEPDEISIESLIYVKNVSSLAKLAQARGAMCAAFPAKHRGKVFEYAPNLVKASVTSHGHASKEGVKKTLGLLIGKKKFETDDESDALAIAICHALIGRSPVKNSKGTPL